MIQNYLPLIRGLIDALLFLECSGDDEVNPDSAVRCMENISSSLRALSTSDQLELRAELVKIAGNANDEKFAKFVRALPDMLGIENSD
jgi:hypothetical protein